MRHGKSWRNHVKSGNRRMRKAIQRGLFNAASHYSNASLSRRLKRV